MRPPRFSAPPARCTLARSRWLAWVLVIVHAVAFANLVAWVVWGGVTHWLAVGFAALLWLVASVSAACFWVRTPLGTLSWDGSVWRMVGPVPGSTELLLGSRVVAQVDLQERMALSFPEQPHGQSRTWLWVEQAHNPMVWGDLRRAVYSRPSTAGLGATGR